MWATIDAEMLDVMNTSWMCVNELGDVTEPFPRRVGAAGQQAVGHSSQARLRARGLSLGPPSEAARGDSGDAGCLPVLPP